MRTETAKKIRQEIKAQLGLNSKHVGVRNHSYSMGSTVYVTIKTVEAFRVLREIKKIAEAFERIDRCSSTGDILGGGNTYVEVSVASEVKEEVRGPFEERAREAVKQAKHSYEYGEGDLVKVEKGVLITQVDRTTLRIYFPGGDDLDVWLDNSTHKYVAWYVATKGREDSETKDLVELDTIGEAEPVYVLDSRKTVYRMTPELEGNKYVVVSCSIDDPFTDKETYIFRATYSQDTWGWEGCELSGSTKGIRNRATALLNAGYRVLEKVAKVVKCIGDPFGKCDLVWELSRSLNGSNYAKTCLAENGFCICPCNEEGINDWAYIQFLDEENHLSVLNKLGYSCNLEEVEPVLREDFPTKPENASTLALDVLDDVDQIPTQKPTRRSTINLTKKPGSGIRKKNKGRNMDSQGDYSGWESDLRW